MPGGVDIGGVSPITAGINAAAQVATAALNGGFDFAKEKSKNQLVTQTTFNNNAASIVGGYQALAGNSINAATITATGWQKSLYGRDPINTQVGVDKTKYIAMAVAAVVVIIAVVYLKTQK